MEDSIEVKNIERETQFLDEKTTRSLMIIKQLNVLII